ncbi:HAD-IIB family hydrolase [Anianabacter salinae]|uniref:HAD-IIB family hydrolase n=1 Tax=Anianabacter salinae TaxID=2851023 RepID=UPI00225E2ADA|nr:HAD-IIB family hydrolase [Anianabacter salinae]MBV0911147.1 HAD family hydrolase [Anianabacter salinae]
MRDDTKDTGIAGKTFVLATDLDGTFLGGTEADRQGLYDWIEARRDSVGLVFVTGRDPAFIAHLCEGRGVPRPDYVIGDVGTTIARMGEHGQPQPIPELEAQIAALWDDAGGRVRAALDGAPGLTLQPTAFRYRVSYDLDPAHYDASAEATIRAMGHDVLISDNRFFDVLPKGISKGPSLLRFLDRFGIDRARCLAAGDTLNDLSMLLAGVPAVAVGGAEKALVAELAGAPHVHLAEGIGAAGIAEAIRTFALHPDPQR